MGHYGAVRRCLTSRMAVRSETGLQPSVVRNSTRVGSRIPDSAASVSLDDCVRRTLSSFDTMTLAHCTVFLRKIRKYEVSGTVPENDTREVLLQNVKDRLGFLISSFSIEDATEASTLRPLLMELLRHVASGEKCLAEIVSGLLALMPSESVLLDDDLVAALQGQVSLSRDLMRLVMSVAKNLDKKSDASSFFIACNGLSLLVSVHSHNYPVINLLLRAITDRVHDACCGSSTNVKDIQPALFRLLQRLVEGDSRDRHQIWSDMEFRRLVEVVVCNSLNPPNSKGWLSLGACLSRTGGLAADINQTSTVYSIICRALESDNNSSFSRKIKLELCIGYKLPGRAVAGACMHRKAAGIVAQKFLAQTLVLLPQKSVNPETAALLAQAVSVQSEFLPVKPHVWEHLFGTLMAAPPQSVQPTDLIEFLDAVGHSASCPATLADKIKTSTMSLLLMSLRSGLDRKTGVLSKWIAVLKARENESSASILVKNEIVINVLGRIRQGVRQVPLDVVVACVMFESDKLRKDELREYFLQQYREDTYLSFGVVMDLIRLGTVDEAWRGFVQREVMNRIKDATKLDIQQTILIGELQRSELWRQRAIEILGTSTPMDNSELMELLKQRQSMLEERVRFPDGRPISRLSFSGLVLTLSLATSGLAEILLGR